MDINLWQKWHFNSVNKVAYLINNSSIIDWKEVELNFDCVFHIKLTPDGLTIQA